MYRIQWDKGITKKFKEEYKAEMLKITQALQTVES